MLYGDKKWDELTKAQKKEIKDVYAVKEGEDFKGAKQSWKNAKAKAQGFSGLDEKKKEIARQEAAKREEEAVETTKPIDYKPETDQSKINHKTIEVKGNDQGWKSTSDEGFDSSKLPPPEEVTGSKWKDENYYKKLGIQTAGAAGQQRGVEARAAAAQQPKSEAALRTERNERINNYNHDYADLKQSLGWKNEPGTEDVRSHLREKLEAGYVTNKPVGAYTGRSWVRGSGVKANDSAMDYLRGIAYGNTPTSYADMLNFGKEGYVPMAEREDTQWRPYGSEPYQHEKTDEFKRGIYDLKLKHGMTQYDNFEDFNKNYNYGFY